jgi:DNA-directed RNA polymerase subunit RPC12/RpoP
MQVPEILAGKRIRCRGCGTTVTVAQRAAVPAHQAHPEDDWEPYTITKEEDKPRCPYCANDVESDQTICLQCGYNLKTREHQKTLVLHPHSGMDYFLWLSPGILSALVALAAIGMIILAWLKQPIFGAWFYEWFQDWRWGRVYLTAFMGIITWLTGKFAFKRLVLNPHPPEVEKHAHEIDEEQLGEEDEEYEEEDEEEDEEDEEEDEEEEEEE